MKLYYVYPYILPLCGTVIDDYQMLAQRYLDKGLYCEYWNSLLRILLRKYGMPINRFYQSSIKLLLEGDNHSLTQSVATWFHDSFAYKQSNIKDKTELNELFSSFLKELIDLELKRKELNNTHSIVILPIIKRVGYYPTIGNEKWECNSLAKNCNLKLNVSSLKKQLI